MSNKTMRLPVLFILSCGLALAVAAAPEKFAPAKYDPFVGDWLPKNAGDYVAQVFATGPNAYQLNVLVAFDDESGATPVAVLRGARPDENSPVELLEIGGGGTWTGVIRPDCCGSPQMEISNPKTNERARLSQFVRPNPRLRAKPPQGSNASVLFAGLMRDGVLTLAREDGPLVSAERVSSVRVHLEFRMLGEQSAAVVTLGRAAWIDLRATHGRNDAVVCGTLNRVAPSARAERALLEWQAIDIEVSSDILRVFLNGVQIHDVTRLADSAERAPVKIETRGAPVELRNIWISAE